MSQINAQTPAKLAPGVDLYATHALCPCIHFCDAPRPYEDRMSKHDERDANARLLSAGFNAFDKAGRELGLDAATLAEGIDLAALIRAARQARDSLNVAFKVDDCDVFRKHHNATTEALIALESILAKVGGETP